MTTPEPSEAYYQAPRTEVARFVPEGIGTLLDVGCGEGAFLDTLRSLRPELQLRGLEPNARAAEAARAKGLEVTTGGFPHEGEPLGTFDCVVFNDVLEHLVDPWTALVAVRDLLAPGGRVVASIPNLRNIETLLELVVGGEFRYREAGVLDRTHLRFFTRASMYELFEGAGFAVEHQEGINPTRSRRRRATATAVGLALPSFRREAPYRQFVTVASPRAAGAPEGGR